MNNGITDLHMHILPDVDDGSPDLETSLTMVREAHSYGITDIFATPHCFSYIDGEDAKAARKAFHELSKALIYYDIPVKLHSACEILCMERWMERVLHYLSTGQFPSMNGSRYVLVEFTTWDISSSEVFFCLNQLLQNDWIPVLAHAERYVSTFASLSFIEEIRRMGCLCQMNLISVCEEKEEDILTFARELIQNEYVDFIGSDAHNMYHRPPQYKKGLSYLRENCSEEYLDKLLYKNAKKYLLEQI